MLPENFATPYLFADLPSLRSRWHISPSPWLRDYLHKPLGGSRGAAWNTYRNLAATMVLGGLWHGASWTFVLWGAMHGVALIVNHQWRERAPAAAQRGLGWGPLAWLLPLLLVVLAWVLFRADGLSTAVELYRAMAGLNGQDG